MADPDMDVGTSKVEKGEADEVHISLLQLLAPYTEVRSLADVNGPSDFWSKGRRDERTRV